MKCLQDLATLRCKQHRQADAAELLEELAQIAPPHPAAWDDRMDGWKPWWHWTLHQGIPCWSWKCSFVSPCCSDTELMVGFSLAWHELASSSPALQMVETVVCWRGHVLQNLHVCFPKQGNLHQLGHSLQSTAAVWESWIMVLSSHQSEGRHTWTRRCMELGDLQLGSKTDWSYHRTFCFLVLPNSKLLIVIRLKM